jgi:hypothetical protein
VAGPILMLLALFVVGPIGLFIVGGIWSALNGWLLSDDADDRANAPAEAAAE